MNLTSAINSGLQGIHTGMEGMARYADKIANQAAHEKETDLADLAESVVGLYSNELQVKASAQVVKTASDTVGSLLDIRA